MDEMFEALANVHHRRLLIALLDHNPQQDQVAVPKDVPNEEESVDALRTEFYHFLLPRLEQAGFIRWSQDTHEVVEGPRFDEIRPLLEL